jgi:ATP-dependent Clp protease ATP-binding subunit ClpA
MSLITYPINTLVHALEQGSFSACVLERQDFFQVAANAEGAKRALMRQLEASWVDDAEAKLLELHRIAAVKDVEQRTIELTMLPMARQAAWKEKWQITLDCFIYSETNDRHHVVLPSPGLHFLVPDRADANALTKAVHQQLQMWLSLKPAPERVRILAQVVQFAHAHQHQRISLDLMPRSAKQREQSLDKQGSDSVLKSVATKLSELAQPAFGTEALSARIADVLTGVMPRSVLLIGPSGCGKTSACVALAKSNTIALPIYTTSGTRLIAGQSGFGMWQARCQQLLRELAHKKDVLHVGRLMELMEVGRTRQGEQSIASFMRADIARGTVLLIAECTPEEFAVLSRMEPGLVDAFEPIDCQVANLAQQLDILKAVSAHWLDRKLDEAQIAALSLCLNLHEQFCSYSARPARAIGFVSRLTQRGADSVLSEASVLRQFIAETGLPELLLLPQKRFERAAITDWFAARVIGQRPAVDVVVDRLSQIKAKLFRRQRPLASLVFIGPTGVGKTEMAKSLAEFLFSTTAKLLRFDLSQVTDAFAVQRLIGSSVFGEPEGLLTARVRENPFSVLLLDEFEKAHSSFFDLLLQILGDGRISDGNGRVADFSNCVIIMTSNLGAKARNTRVGFTQATLAADQHYQRALQDFLRPEIYNRFDAVVPFASLGSEQVAHVLARELAALTRRRFFFEHGVQLALDEAAQTWLAAKGFDAQYGARALKRSVERFVAEPLADVFAQTRAAQTKDKSQALDKNQTALRFAGSFDSAQDTHLQLRRESHAALAPSSKHEVQASAIAHAARASELRRELDELCAFEEVSNWQDERLLLVQQQKRCLKRKQQLPARDERRLLALNHALELLAQTLIAAERNEDACVLAALATGAAMPTEANASAASLLSVKQSLLRLRYPNADSAHIAVMADHAEWLLVLLRSYQELSAKEKWTCTLTHLIERPPVKTKSAELKVLRIIPIDQIKKAEAIFEAASSHYLGAVLQFNGENAALKMALETGLHVLKKRANDGEFGQRIKAVGDVDYAKLYQFEGECCARVVPFNLKFSVPFALAKPKQLAQLNELRRRVFDLEREEIHDGLLEDLAPRAKFKNSDLPAAMQSAFARSWTAELIRFGKRDPKGALREALGV